VHDRQCVLGPLDLVIGPGERWVVLGPNGSGKTTLVSVLSMYRHPTTGTVEILGERWGATDVRELRRSIGLSSAALRSQLRPSLIARDVVMTARFAALEPWWHAYDDDDRSAADAALQKVGIGHLADRTIGTLSSGEQQRVLLARALFGRPGLLLLDEPTAGLDIAGRRQLLDDLDHLARNDATPPIVLVTHHADELPESFTHALLLNDGDVVASGPIGQAMTPHNVAACLGVVLRPGDIVRSYFAACTAGTATEIADHFTDEAVIFDTNHAPVRSAGGIGAFWDRMRAKWRGAEWLVDTVVDDGDRVAIEWTMRGMVTSSDGGEEPFAFRGSEHYEFEGDRIAQIRQYWTFDAHEPGSALVEYDYEADHRFAASTPRLE
jgi:iron complex transport system ATP-binding protein